MEQAFEVQEAGVRPLAYNFRSLSDAHGLSVSFIQHNWRELGSPGTKCGRRTLFPAKPTEEWLLARQREQAACDAYREGRG